MTTNIYVPESAPTEVAVLTSSDIGVSVAPFEVATQDSSSNVAVTFSSTPLTVATLNIAANEPVAGTFYEILASGSCAGNLHSNELQASVVWGSTTLLTTSAEGNNSNSDWMVHGWVNFISTTTCYGAALLSLGSAVPSNSNSTFPVVSSQGSTPSATTVTVSSATTLNLQIAFTGSSCNGSIQCFLITRRV